MPSSWEILELERRSVLIAFLLPPGENLSYDWCVCFKELERPPLTDHLRLRGLPWGCARTEAAYACLEKGYSYLLFWDCDVHPPTNGLTRLMSHNLPIVGGIYRQKFYPYHPAAFLEQKDPNTGKLGKVPIDLDKVQGQLVRVDLCPMGFTLIHRSVFEKLQQAGINRFFEWSLHRDQPPEGGRSEDFEFSARVRSLGIQPAIDTSVFCYHELVGPRARVGPKGLEAPEV